MKERKVNLGSAIVGGFVTLVIGVVVGLNWNTLSVQFGPYFGAKKVGGMSFDEELNEVYQKLVANYDGVIDKDDVFEEAKRGLVNAAGDDYTYYLTRAESTEFKKSLEGDAGVGVGVEIGLRDGWVKVLRTTPDNPARKAGILAGDIIYKVDGEDVTGLSSEEVANRVRGAAGTSVTVTVARGNDELSFTMVREAINNVSAYVDYRGDVGVLTLTRFDNETGSLAKRLAQEMKDRGVKKVVLDLRGNAGGYVDAARDVVSLWVDGELVAEQKSLDGAHNTRTTALRGQAILADMKTVVLVNGSSASASEIVAGALQDYGKATLIGEKTYGKGSVQSLVELSGGALLRVTSAKWYTPEGRNIQGEGIEPDEVVERSFEQINKDVDPQMERALVF